jgi:predicted TPR repeat methyltransferase
MTSTADKRIDSVYHSASREQLAKTYDEWASDYDADMQSTGYIHPAVMIGLVARYVKDPAAAILDAGVGTGTLGQLLSILNYTNLHGVDISKGMLAIARERTVYAQLSQGILGEPLDFKTASMHCIVSTGTFTTGHAPASAFDELVRITKPGGYLIFTVGTVVWDEAGFAAKLAALETSGHLIKAETTPIYHPMPKSKTESGFTTRAHVYRRS